MKIPLRPSMLKLRRQSVKWIIIHHTVEMYDIPSARIDNAKYQLPALFKGVLEKKQGDINYNYVIEKVQEDYVPFITRPTPYLCTWDDIEDNINNRALHVAALGSYDFLVPENRLYQVLAYRVLNPMLKLYGISPSKIKFHNEVSSNKDLTCPGDFMDKDRLIAQVRRYVVK